MAPDKEGTATIGTRHGFSAGSRIAIERSTEIQFSFLTPNLVG
jgi:hypothetical protein